ncbi:MAG TPA: vanadium-dependent haloperoxidase [Woeseiaceae bacterium]|nr:vanadium-dependent haloperoxidase [Woeseiaceae bacterium]
MKTLAIAALLGCLTSGASWASAVSHDDTTAWLLEWNETVLRLAEAEDGFLTLKAVRTAAMMHLAVHDALNNIDGRYATYAYAHPEPRANPQTAAVEAAYTVVVDQYPGQESELADLRDRWLPASVGPREIVAGRRLGKAAAEAIIAKRAGDGWNGEAEYNWHPMAPGVYAEFDEHSGTPKGFVFGSGWVKVHGFALTRPDEFRAPPPPEINSSAYTRAYNEVREVGRFQSMSRTPDQTHLALWWKDFEENAQNRLARDLILKEQPDLVTANRLFALINMSIFDAYISSFNNKFFYNHWRPYTAIRWAAHDGNPDTEADESWNNTHRHTYAFPSYPSAHGMACGAAAIAFIDVFGDNYAFTMRNPVVDIAGPMSEKIEMHPPTRTFSSFSDAALECAMSRVYLGIHFRYDSEEGVKLGEVVGHNVVNKLLRKN